MRRERERLRSTPAWAERRRVTERVLAAWSGFYAEERDAVRTWRWCSGEGTIRLLNPAQQPKTLRMTLYLHPAVPFPLAVRVSGLVEDDLTVVGLRQEFARTLVVPPGESVLHFAAGGATLIPPADGRTLMFAVEDFTLRE